MSPALPRSRHPLLSPAPVVPGRTKRSWPTLSPGLSVGPFGLSPQHGSGRRGRPKVRPGASRHPREAGAGGLRCVPRRDPHRPARRGWLCRGVASGLRVKSGQHLAVFSPAQGLSPVRDLLVDATQCGFWTRVRPLTAATPRERVSVGHEWIALARRKPPSALPGRAPAGFRAGPRAEAEPRPSPRGGDRPLLPAPGRALRAGRLPVSPAAPHWEMTNDQKINL